MSTVTSLISLFLGRTYVSKIWMDFTCFWLIVKLLFRTPDGVIVKGYNLKTDGLQITDRMVFAVITLKADMKSCQTAVTVTLRPCR